ncbi:hypothetical protein [Paratissierella segnis]|jgi:amino acid transporter|uniref:Uncharacterized protein n=1 Tax=Paratissierella segnis TaxID=2763679 RepID=A0A926IJ47_9FIRM|nr:hypothetical protein [Paratissierella segnis]MBC8586860.1 hypothetical protein [Paratissierella segnis]
MLYVIIIFLIISFIDLPNLIKKDSKKELIVVCSILCFGFILSSLYALGIDLPSPLVGIENFLKNILKLGYKDQ